MVSFGQVFLLLSLVCISAFFSSAEISIAASRKSRLQSLYEDGERRAKLVLDLQEHPGPFFSALQVAVNAVALLGGIVGDAAFSPFFDWCLSFVLKPDQFPNLGFILSFILSTSLFVIFADLLPKRLALIKPEPVAMFVVRPMRLFIRCLRPIVFLLSKLSDSVLRACGFPTQRQDSITPEDILASVGAGAKAGIIAPQEEAVIQNVFELESRLVPSAMTPRENIVFFTLDEEESSVRAKIATVPYNRFLVCDRDLDHVVGFVDSKHLLRCVLDEKPIVFKEHGLVQSCQFIPDSLTLSEALDVFQRTKSDFAIILNEYALVVGLITINDIMSTVMGDLVITADEQQIIRRDENSWIIDGSTPVDDVQHALQLGDFPEDSTYETVAGFMMYMLRKIPKITDKVTWNGYTFEVLDVDNHKIDQVLVTRTPESRVSDPQTNAGAAASVCEPKQETADEKAN